MIAILDHFTIEKMWSFTKKVVFIDIAINVFVGLALLSAPNLLNRILFNKQLLPHWVFILMGIGFLLFAFWQLVYFIKPGGFTVQNLHIAAVLAWIPFLLLSIGLLSNLGRQLLTASKIILWLADIYMLLLGGLYWGLASKIKRES